MNEPGDRMYFIKSGCVQIKNHDCTVVFASLKSGAYFGELAMLTHQRRTATAQARRYIPLHPLHPLTTPTAQARSRRCPPTLVQAIYTRSTCAPARAAITTHFSTHIMR